MTEKTEKLEFHSIYKSYEHSSPFLRIGKVRSTRGMVYEISLPKACLGNQVEFVTERGERCYGEVVAIQQDSCFAMPYNEISGINSETKVIHRDLTTSIKISPNMLGRVVDYLGKPIDGKGSIKGIGEKRSIFGEFLNPLERPPIKKTLDTGVHAIDGFCTFGEGQRVGILAGSGVGKSVLMGMISRNTNADVNVIALIGERGREVREFIENDLGKEGLERTVIVVATSDQSALIRSRAAYTATTIAEYFRDRGSNVLLMMDSITRFAMANREIGLSAGEPPGQKGYSPSVFAKLPKLMERAGTKEGAGSITGIYTVLVEGNDIDEPIADAVRSISDGHVVLSRELAMQNHYPAIDILGSISRVMNKVISKEHRIIASHLRDLLASYKNSEDLINVGAYVQGSNSKVDKALIIYEDLQNLLKQNFDECLRPEELYDRLVELARKAEEAVNPTVLDEDENQTPDEYNVV